jgi:hypothetical protein
MAKLSELFRMITGRHGSVLDLNKNPEILMDIITELRINEQDASGSPAKNAAPFGIPWMDSWAASWVLHQPAPLSSRPAPEDEFRTVIKQLTDLKFRDRLQEIKQFIIDQHGVVNEPPDGGPPEPGTPNPGPSSIFNDDPEPPDGGTPEPGVPPTPPPPDPGPDGGILRENPWVLYWFVSINAPLILDMIDAHFTRRMNDLRQQMGK